MFLDREDWWDVIANTEDGAVRVSTKECKDLPAPAPAGDDNAQEEPLTLEQALCSRADADNTLIDSILGQLEDDECTETWLRSLFWRHTQRSLDMCFRKEEFMDRQQSHSALQKAAPLLHLLKRSQSYVAYLEEMPVGMDRTARIHMMKLLGLLSEEGEESINTLPNPNPNPNPDWRRPSTHRRGIF